MSPDLIVIPLLPLEKYENEQKLINWLSVMQSIGIGPGLGRDLILLKNFGKILKCLKNKLVVGDADFFWFLMQDFEGFNKYLKNCRKLVLTPNKVEFGRLFKFHFKKEFDFGKLDLFLEKQEGQGFNDIVEIDLYGKMPEFRYFYEIFDNKNVFFLLKYKNDVIFGPDKCYLVKNKSSKKRCGGQGDILTGLTNLFLLWSDRTNVKTEISLVFASFITRKSSLKAYKKKKLGLVASDIIPEVTEVMNSYLEKDNSYSESDFGILDN